MVSFKYLDCESFWDKDTLVIRNSKIMRKWKTKNGLCFNEALMDNFTSKQYLTCESNQPSPSPEFIVKEECIEVLVHAEQWQPIIVEQVSLRVVVHAKYANYDLKSVFKIYPSMPAISSHIEVSGRGVEVVKGQQNYSLMGDGVEIDEIKRRMEDESLVDNNEIYYLDHIHAQLGIVALMDHTDNKDNLVRVQEDLLTVASEEEYSANLFYTEDQFTREGLIFLKEAPLPYARPDRLNKDLIYNSGLFQFCGLGAGDNSERSSYPFTTIVYQGGKYGRMRALQEYQRCFRAFNPQNDMVIWYCIWGDRNRDGKICEKYMFDSADMVEEIGMDFLYFIDGWQKGVSSNSVINGGVWSNQWEQEDYWTENPKRFPNGLMPVVEKANKKGLKMGSWYNPDKTDNYKNWSKDADILINLYKKYGFQFFKFDGVTFTTKEGEKNLINAMHKVVHETDGRASIEIDITAGIRTGYFFAMQYGILFLENRYTDWRKYYPHCVLRNLWKLSEFVDPKRIRVEFLNNERNKHLYSNDALAPANYNAEYLFAITMFANPLAWLEIPELSAEYKIRLKKIISIYKQHRKQIHSGNIYPLGDEPLGFSWTGFISISQKNTNGYVLVFRELNESESYCFKLPFLQKGSYMFEFLAGNGQSFEANIKEFGDVRFKLPEKLSFGFYAFNKTNSLLME